MFARVMTGLIFAGLMAASALAGTVFSRFDASAQGWSAIDLEGAGNYASIFGTYPASWNAVGGNPDGHVSTNDPTSGSMFFRASAGYLGNKSAYGGETLSFDLKTTHDTYADDSAVILVGSGGQIIATPITPPAVDVWQSYTVVLDAAAFRQNNLLGGPVSAGAFGAILADLEEIYIPAEFAAGLIETTRLDNVVLTPEPASLAAVAVLLAGVIRRR